MKQTPVLATALMALLPAVRADFHIYAAALSDGLGPPSDTGVQVYAPTDGLVDCGSALDWIWGPLDDVSGNKYGVRCEGAGCFLGVDDDPATITELELNTRTGPHFTYYQSRGGAIVGIDDVSIGTCTAADNGNEVCGGDDIGQANISRKLYCVSSLTADDINSNKPS